MQTYIKPIRLILILLVTVGILSVVVDLGRASTLPASITILTAPYNTLPPHEHETARGDTIETEGHVESIESEFYTAPQDMWITGFEIRSVNAPRFIIHHMVLAVPEWQNEHCPGIPAMLMDIGQDAVPFGDLPKGYGMFVPKGTKLKVTAALHNPEPPLGTGETYTDVQVGFTLHTSRFGSLKQLTPVSLAILSLADAPACNATVFTVPPHTQRYVQKPKTTDTGPRMVFQKSATIVAMGAHLHAWEGGEKLEVFKNGKSITSFHPLRVQEKPALWHTLPFLDPVHVKAGDEITIEATYSNKYAIPETGAMGMTALFIAYDE